MAVGDDRRSVYAKRMDIEEQIRDAKGCRFGLKMKWTQHQNHAYLERLMLLIAVALLIWSVAGNAKTTQDPSACLPSKTKGVRLSMPEVGFTYLQEFHRRLTRRFLRQHRQPPCPTQPDDTLEVVL